MTLCGAVFRERLASALEFVVERTQDFTDSAYTSHQHREKILLICDRLKLELNQLLSIGVCLVSLQPLSAYPPARLFPLSLPRHDRRLPISVCDCPEYPDQLRGRLAASKGLPGLRAL